jgi:zinc protease
VESSRLIFSRIRAGYCLSALLFLLAVSSASAQDLSAPLTLDPAIHTGKLPNGLRYLIRKNARPEHRAALRLAVKAGSVDEADDQRGLAHFVEHMAFNGTTHFKPGELVAYLESIGARFGADANAYTSYDETVYMLDVPTDREGMLDRGFVALSDFAGGLTLDPKEIDRERGVIIEEWRQRQGAGSRIQAVQMPALFGKSRYADRLPIGTVEILKSFPAQRLRDFYEDNYRPDRMAVIVVGDIDPVAAEQLIRQHFSSWKRGPPSKRPVYGVPGHRETRFAIATDREAQGSSVTILHKHPAEMLRTVGDYRRTLIEGLATDMLNARLGEIARRPDAPFISASTGRSGVGQTTEALTLAARVSDGRIPQGLAAIAQEIARVEQHGFGQAELERTKKGLLAGYDRAYNEREKSESGGFAFELLRYFLEDEGAPGIQTEFDLARRFVPSVTADQVASQFRKLISDRNRVVLAVAPQKDGVPTVTEAALRDSLRQHDARVAAWQDETSERELMPTRPEAGSVRSRREIPEIGVTVLTLSNGAEVWLKPTDFKNDQILFSGYARGGTSLADEANYHNAALSTSLVSVGGVGGFTPVELGKLLAGRIVNVSPYMSTFTHGLSGSSTPRDLEVGLQLLYLNVTAPNATDEAFTLMKRRLEASLANQEQNPGAVFSERLRAINTMNHYTSRPMRTKDIGGLNAQRMVDYYKARFANAADFTFFFVGAFTVDDITPLLTTYIASLPSTGARNARIGDVRLQFPATIARETVNKGREPRSQTVLSFFADTGLDELEMHRVRAATSVLEMHLREILREELGGTYSVGVGYSNTQPQPGYGATSVQFGSAPDNVEKLVSAVMTELDRLRREGPSAEDLQKIKETERRELETSMRQNGYWLNSLDTLHLLGWDPLRITKRFERTEALTLDNIHDAFRKYFPPDRYTVVTLMPETSASN